MRNRYSDGAGLELFTPSIIGERNRNCAYFFCVTVNFQSEYCMRNETEKNEIFFLEDIESELYMKYSISILCADNKYQPFPMTCDI